MKDFLPSKNGWKFNNDFPHEPDIIINLPIFGKIGIGDAYNGLCGGMVYSCLDYYLAGQPIPNIRTPPTHKHILQTLFFNEDHSPVFKHIYKRLFDSFGFPCTTLKYYYWMSSWSSLFGKTVREFKILKEKLKHRPVPLGMIRYYSVNPLKLGENHQILAYKIKGNACYIYDPDYALRDDITLTIDFEKKKIFHSEDGEQRGFFITDYSFVRPT